MKWLATAGMLLIACGGGEANPDAAADAGVVCTSFPSTGDLPCDVSAVLMAKCQPCHRNPPRNHAPFPEVTFEDLEQPFGTAGLHRWQRMAQVIVPGDTIHMPPAGQPQLSDAELHTLLDWFAACAPPLPEGTGCDGTPPDAQVPGDGGSGDLATPNGDGGGACVALNGDCSGGQPCCGSATCDPTTSKCVPPPCMGKGGDCSIAGCCAGLNCTLPSYLCK